MHSSIDIEAAKVELHREFTRRSFADFVRIAWPMIEPNPLVWSWHMGAICEHLQACTLGQIRNLVICVPPGGSKSLLVSTLWPAYVWALDPTKRFIAATYEQRLSEKNARLHRDLCASDWYATRWPESRVNKADVAQVQEFRTMSKGFRFSTSVGGPAMGRHGDIQIGDDLVKGQDAEGRQTVDTPAIERANDFWEKTMPTRAARPEKLIRVMIAQRLVDNDPPGRMIDAGAVALVLPMEYERDRHCKTIIGFSDPRTEEGELLAPERFPASVVSALKLQLGPRAAAAQLQQHPTPKSGDVFKPEYFTRRYKALPDRDKSKIIMTVDCNFKDRKDNDRVAIGVWFAAGPHYYKADFFRDNIGFVGTQKQIAIMADRWNPHVIYIEDKANGPAIYQTLKSAIPIVKEWTPTGSKIARAETGASVMEGGTVYFPEDNAAPWMESYKSELLAFPKGAHDDAVDETSMALLILHKPGLQRYLKALGEIRPELVS